MLNDLFIIEQAFLANGDAVGATHADVKDMARGPAFRLRLDNAARLAAVELIDDAGRGAVWTLRDGQHNGFPGLKTKVGLLDIGAAELESHDALWKKSKTGADRRQELRRLAQTFSFRASNWPEAGHRKRVAERLDQLRALSDDPNAAAVPAAFERFLRGIDAPVSLLAQLTEKLIEALEIRNDDWLDPIRAAFIGPMALAIDIVSGEFSREAGDRRQVGAVSAALSAATGASSQDGICALSGARVALHRGNYPQPNLPGLGQSYIYSRNSDIPSLKRYGKIAETSFSVGADLAQRLGGVLAKLTAREQEGETWRLIPAEAGDKQDLILCSIAVLSDFVDDASDDEATDVLAAEGRAFFEQLAVKKGGRLGMAPDVSILVLRTVDPANRKAIYSRRIAAQRMDEAALRWRQAARNLPDRLGFFMPKKGEKTPLLHRPPHVAPLSLTPLTRGLFVVGGRRRIEIVGLGASDAMGLFLGEGDERARATKILRAFLHRCDGLLLNLASVSREGGEALRALDPKLDLRRHALRILSWLGVLLFFLRRPKEIFMNDPAFRLGQFLSAADLLHIGYCADRRNGNVPPVLVGASAMSLAGGDPVRALAVLQQRLKPYFAWITSGRVGDLQNRARILKEEGKKAQASAIWTSIEQYSRLKEMSEPLSHLVRPLKGKKTDDLFRAELLLGYIAGFPKIEKADKRPANDSDPKIVENDHGETE